MIAKGFAMSWQKELSKLPPEVHAIKALDLKVRERERGVI